jgi:hypothetical protein
MRARRVVAGGRAAAASASTATWAGVSAALVLCWAFSASAAASVDTQPPPAKVDAAKADTNAALGVEEIVARSVKASGGLEAWRKINTMVWVGHLVSVDAPDPNMPFLLEQERPNKSHFEIESMGQKTMRVFDGIRGWKARPAQGGSSDIQPFTSQEVKFAHDAPGIDGPLIDYAAKGSTIALAGVDDIEGRKNYHVAVKLASGERHDVWIDAQTFLETRYDRTSYSTRGVPGIVSVFYRKYRVIEGLAIPGEMEIGVGSARAPDKMIIEKVAINPPLDEKAFQRPGGLRRRGSTIIDMDPTKTMPGPGVGPASAPPGQAPAPEQK